MNFSHLVEVLTSFTENTEASCSTHSGKCESEGESISNSGAAGRTPLQSPLPFTCDPEFSTRYQHSSAHKWRENYESQHLKCVRIKCDVPFVEGNVHPKGLTESKRFPTFHITKEIKKAPLPSTC